MDSRKHDIFSRFSAFQGEVPAGFNCDFIGAMTKGTFEGGVVDLSKRVVTAAPPAVDSEYFEWIDLLSSVEKASGSYTVVELGAGYGRWAVRAALAARQRGLPSTSILVEAEPVHAQWAREHLAANGVDGHVIEAAAGRSRSKMSFAVRPPPEWKLDDPKDWYGQAMFPGQSATTGETYHGKPLSKIGEWGTIEVDVLPLSEILDGVDTVDLLDMDIQGAEADVVAGGIDALDAKVKLMHIGTHYVEVEDTIRSQLAAHGWVLSWDYRVGSTTITPYGEVTFQDGVQSWRNPRFL